MVSDLLDAKATCKFLGCSRTQLWRWTESGLLSKIKLGTRFIRWRRPDLNDFVKLRRTPMHSDRKVREARVAAKRVTDSNAPDIFMCAQCKRLFDPHEEGVNRESWMSIQSAMNTPFMSGDESSSLRRKLCSPQCAVALLEKEFPHVCQVCEMRHHSPGPCSKSCRNACKVVTRDFSPETFIEEVSDGLRSRKVCGPSSGSSEVG
jgi:predicted DNA-binding transcriptional regulator AlpA